MRWVYRWEVAVDDEPHTLTAPPGRVLHVDCRRADAVEVWLEHDDDVAPVARTFLVVGTGQPYGDEWRAMGSALTPEQPATHSGGVGMSTARRPRGVLVWHLLERQP